MQDVHLGDYPGVQDGWMDVIASQGSSLLSVDVSGSDMTDSGMKLLKGCSNLQALALNYCDQFSEHGLKHISGNVTISYFQLNTYFAFYMYRNYELCIVVFVRLFYVQNRTVVINFGISSKRKFLKFISVNPYWICNIGVVFSK